MRRSSFLPDDADEPDLSDEQWAQICDELVAGMGFADLASDDAPGRWVALRHCRSKTGNDHVHVVVGLVREDGSKARGRKDRETAQQLTGELERRHGLQVLESRQTGASARGHKPASVAVATATSSHGSCARPPQHCRA